MNIDLSALSTNLVTTVTQLGLKILGAIAIWIIGRMLISSVLNLLSRSLEKQNVDATVAGYLRIGISVVLRLALILALLGFFGVETSSFAALLAAAGVAIGMAWSGLLANFAAGVFLVILRPFKKNDFVTAGGVTGTVKEIGLFGTTVDTPDGVMTIVGNGKILSDNIQNFTTNPLRRVDLTAQLAHGVDPQSAMKLLREGMRQIPNVAQSPAPETEILAFNMAGPVLAVRPYTNNTNYWQVYFDTNRMIAQTFSSAGYPVPADQHLVYSGTLANRAGA
jgi:small conductance mechanosensitive channel